jgi:hypothetical protein
MYSKSDTAMFGLIEKRITCETTFEIQDRRVISSTFEGGQCWGKSKYKLNNRQFMPPDTKTGQKLKRQGRGHKNREGRKRRSR